MLKVNATAVIWYLYKSLFKKAKKVKGQRKSKVKSLRTQASGQLSTHLQSRKLSGQTLKSSNPQSRKLSGQIFKSSNSQSRKLSGQILKSSNSQIFQIFKSSVKTKNAKHETRNSPVKSVNYATYLWHSVRIPTQKLIIFV